MLSFRTNLRTAVILLTACLLLLGLVPSPTLAITPHEDPEEAAGMYSGVALLVYLADVMDFVLVLDVDEVETLLARVRFANLPTALAEAAGEFAVSGVELSHLLQQIDGGIGELVTLASQFRLAESIRKAAETLGAVAEAESNLSEMEQSTEVAGDVLGDAGCLPDAAIHLATQVSLLSIMTCAPTLTWRSILVGRYSHPKSPSMLPVNVWSLPFSPASRLAFVSSASLLVVVRWT